MLKYFTISFVINLLLFVVYAYWLSTLSTKMFKNFEPLPPLQVRIVTIQKVPFEELKKQKTHQKVRLKSHRRKGQKRVSKPSLIAELSKTVKGGFLPLLKRERLYASAKINKEGKLELNLKRRLVYIPPTGILKVSTPPAPAEVKVTVLPDGRVVEAVLTKKSGNPKVDQFLVNFSKNLRFEPIDEETIQEIYILYNFKIR